MSDKITISAETLSDAVAEQLELYRKSTQLQIDKCAGKATKELVRITKDTAPYSAKHHGKHFVNCISSKRESTSTRGAVYTWYVEDPCYRLTHLLVNGHATRDGGRTKKDPFLKNACDKVLPQFEEDVIKAVKGDGS